MLATTRRGAERAGCGTDDLESGDLRPLGPEKAETHCVDVFWRRRAFQGLTLPFFSAPPVAAVLGNFPPRRQLSEYVLIP